MTTTALDTARPRPRRHPRRTAALFGFGGTLLLALLLGTAVSLVVAVRSNGVVMPGVSVAGIELSGLDRSSAAQRLSAGLPSLSSGSATLVVDGETVTVPYARIGRGYELDVMLDAAFAAGRSADPLTNALDRLRLLARGEALVPLVHGYDADAIAAVASEIATRFSRDAVAAGISLEHGRFVVSPASDGRQLDPALVRQVLGNAASTSDPADVTVRLSTRQVIAETSTAAARAAATTASAMAQAPLSLVVSGDAPRQLSAAQLASLVRFDSTADGSLVARVDAANARRLVQKLAPGLARSPRDASYVFGGDGIMGVVPAVAGRTLNVAAATTALIAALDARAAGGSATRVTLAFSVTQPSLSTAAAQAASSRIRQLSSWTTYYVSAEGNYWGANISIPARDIDGRVLAPGDWFDFWKSIGPVTTARGYGQGGAIIGGRSVANGALAGGICSTSTTIFNAALRAGLQIGERTNHYYYIDRYPMGLDATVFQTDSYSLTTSFRNDTAWPIIIRSYTGPGFVRFDLWGVPDGRTVVLTQPIITNQRAARDTTVVNTSLKAGQAVRVEYPHNGFDSSVTRYVRDAAGKLIHQDLFNSSYRPVDGITEVGPRPAAPSPTPKPSPTSS